MLIFSKWGVLMLKFQYLNYSIRKCWFWCWSLGANY